MINETDKTSEANVPLDEAKTSGPKDRIKDYGKKSLTPLLELAHKYRADINPFFEAVGKGLDGASSALKTENSSDIERQVGDWFQQASGWIGEARGKLEASNPHDLTNFVQSQANAHPGLMFSSSYFIGLFLGRLGRHIVRGVQSENRGSYTSQGAPDWGDQTTVQ